MIVKNESENLRECLEAAYPLVNQIIVVDTGSQDNTVDIAKSFEAEVFNLTGTTILLKPEILHLASLNVTGI